MWMSICVVYYCMLPPCRLCCCESVSCFLSFPASLSVGLLQIRTPLLSLPGLAFSPRAPNPHSPNTNAAPNTYPRGPITTHQQAHIYIHAIICLFDCPCSRLLSPLVRVIGELTCHFLPFTTSAAAHADAEQSEHAEQSNSTPARNTYITYARDEAISYTTGHIRLV